MSMTVKKKFFPLPCLQIIYRCHISDLLSSVSADNKWSDTKVKKIVGRETKKFISRVDALSCISKE